MTWPANRAPAAQFLQANSREKRAAILRDDLRRGPWRPASPTWKRQLGDHWTCERFAWRARGVGKLAGIDSPG